VYLSVVSSLLLSIRQVFFIYWPNPLAPLAIDDDLMLWVFFSGNHNTQSWLPFVNKQKETDDRRNSNRHQCGK